MNIINTALENELLLEVVMRKFRDGFRDLVAALQTDIQAAVAADLDVIKGTLDMVRNENVALQSEEDVAFRARVADKVRDAKQGLERVLARVGEGARSRGH